MRSPGDVLYNFHWVVRDEIARSAQAYAGFLGGFLKAHNIATVVNLRGANPKFGWWRYEKRICAKLGIAHTDVQMNSRQLPQRALLIEMLDAFDQAKRPILIKCSGGQDRTSFACALYLLNRFGWNARAQAQEQFSRWPYLHFPKAHQRWLRAFPEFAEQHARGATLRSFVENVYDQDVFKAWLVAKGMGDSFRRLAGR